MRVLFDCVTNQVNANYFCMSPTPTRSVFLILTRRRKTWVQTLSRLIQHCLYAMHLSHHNQKHSAATMQHAFSTHFQQMREGRCVFQDFRHPSGSNWKNVNLYIRIGSFSELSCGFIPAVQVWALEIGSLSKLWLPRLLNIQLIQFPHGTPQIWHYVQFDFIPWHMVDPAIVRLKVLPQTGKISSCRQLHRSLKREIAHNMGWNRGSDSMAWQIQLGHHRQHLFHAAPPPISHRL